MPKLCKNNIKPKPWDYHVNIPYFHRQVIRKWRPSYWFPDKIWADRYDVYWYKLKTLYPIIEPHCKNKWHIYTDLSSGLEKWVAYLYRFKFWFWNWYIRKLMIMDVLLLRSYDRSFLSIKKDVFLVTLKSIAACVFYLLINWPMQHLMFLLHYVTMAYLNKLKFFSTELILFPPVLVYWLSKLWTTWSACLTCIWPDDIICPSCYNWWM